MPPRICGGRAPIIDTASSRHFDSGNGKLRINSCDRFERGGARTPKPDLSLNTFRGVLEISEMALQTVTQVSVRVYDGDPLVAHPTSPNTSREHVCFVNTCSL